ncbi:MAG: S8 family serine peptidase [Pyrinomonadaceae bacterium]
MFSEIVLDENFAIAPPEAPVQFDQPQLTVSDVEVDSLIRVNRARDTFKVNGSGLAVAVLDTGLRTTHVDFAGKVVAQQNFTTDNGNNPNDASDGQGHGTNVGGIIVANDLHTGIAPSANIVPLKVLQNVGGGSFATIDSALQWVLTNHANFGISVVNMSLSWTDNNVDDLPFSNLPTTRLIAELKARNVAVVVAAGNYYGKYRSQGMGFPAILRDVVSVGAVYDSNIGGPLTYFPNTTALTTSRDQITPFSQRLHPALNPATCTDIFAPGAPITSSGIQNDRGESIQSGTSQASPVTAGVILLMQDFFKKNTGQLPDVDLIINCLKMGSVAITDGDDENDNVPHTNRQFPRIDALLALEAVRRSLQLELLTTGAAFH